MQRSWASLHSPPCVASSSSCNFPFAQHHQQQQGRRRVGNDAILLQRSRAALGGGTFSTSTSSSSTTIKRRQAPRLSPTAAYQPDPRNRRAPTDLPPWEGVSSYDYPPPYGQQQPPPPPGGGGGPGGGSDGGGGMSNAVKAIIVAAFILGVGAGTWFDSEATFAPQNVASTQIIDRRTPNSEVCMANGYSSMVFDQRIFVSFNPFNVYVSQPEVKPGCVLRRSNVNVLESRGLVKGGEVSACKSRMNTFAFVGDLDNSPEVSCVYHSEDAENQFLRNPEKAVLGDGISGNSAGSAGAPTPAK